MYARDFLGGDPARFSTGLLGKAAAAGSTLLNGLVAYWPLDEVSGTRADAVGSNDLTDNNTVGVSLAGPSGTVAKFVDDNAEYLSNTNTTDWNTVESMAVWVRFSGTPVDLPLIIGRNEASRGLEIYWNQTAQQFAGVVHESAGGERTASLQATGVGGDGKWHFLVIWVDGSNVNMQMDLGTPATAAYDGTLAAATGQLELGSWSYGSFNGDMAYAGAWSRELTSGERTSLFNSGVGKSYADLTTAEKVDLVSYWNLDETSGTRADSHGANDLTDNNTVGSVVNAGGAMHNAAASFVAANTESLSIAAPAEGLRFEDSDFTIAIWVKLSSMTAPVAFIGRGELPVDYLLYSSNADGALRFYRNSSYISNTDVDFRGDTDWHLLLAWFNATTDTAYLSVDNGTAVSGSLSGAVVNDLFKISGYGAGTTNPVNGLIDEVAIWSRVLTADEIAELWASGAGVYYNGSDFV